MDEERVPANSRVL